MDIQLLHVFKGIHTSLLPRSQSSKLRCLLEKVTLISDISVNYSLKEAKVTFILLGKWASDTVQTESKVRPQTFWHKIFGQYE